MLCKERHGDPDSIAERAGEAVAGSCEARTWWTRAKVRSVRLRNAGRPSAASLENKSPFSRLQSASIDFVANLVDENDDTRLSHNA